MLLANKADVPVEDRAVSPDETKQLAEKLGKIPLIETSAKEGVGVAEAFEIMVRCAFVVVANWCRRPAKRWRGVDDRRLDDEMLLATTLQKLRAVYWCCCGGGGDSTVLVSWWPLCWVCCRARQEECGVRCAGVLR